VAVEPHDDGSEEKLKGAGGDRRPSREDILKGLARVENRSS
jgi:hypothetical protein